MKGVALIIAGFQIVGSSLCLIAILIMLAISISGRIGRGAVYDWDLSFLVSSAVLIFGIAYHSINLRLGIMLWNGVQKNDPQRCVDWVVGFSMIVAINFGLFVLPIFVSLPLWFYVPGIIGIVVSLGCLRVVSLAIDEIEDDLAKKAEETQPGAEIPTTEVQSTGKENPIEVVDVV